MVNVVKYDTMRFSCRTLFDITATGVTGHFKVARVPFRDDTGEEVSDEMQWNRARNQQRNWETISQLISLRTQINNSTRPERQDQSWYFEFESDTPDVFGTAENPVELLVSDEDLVPMLVGLDEVGRPGPVIRTQGQEPNTWFEKIL